MEFGFRVSNPLKLQLEDQNWMFVLWFYFSGAAFNFQTRTHTNTEFTGRPERRYMTWLKTIVFGKGGGYPVVKEAWQIQMPQLNFCQSRTKGLKGIWY